MKKILIATRNKDKFKIISKLLSIESFKDYKFISLNDIEEDIIDKKEVGDVINRSYEKALNVYDNLKNNIYDYIVGVDDGIKMKGKMIENVKEYIKSILDNEYLKENEEIYIVRAYTFFDKNKNYKSIITEIPFKYIPLKEKFEIKKESYPLSHVMAPLNSIKTVSNMDDEESNLYYLNYSKEAYNEVKKYFNNILISNIDKIHTTELGLKRIEKNINIHCDDIVSYIKNKIQDKNCNIYKIGKNWYCEIDNIKITINSYTYSIITVHTIK